MKTYRFEQTQFVPKPLDEVFEFFCNAENLEILTPDFLEFRILTPGPITMHAGAHIRYKLKLRGIPIRWKTEILVWQPPRTFVDVQLSGPYRVWHHTHRFEEVDGGTKMMDVVRYALPLGPIGRIAHALSVKRDVETIFNYRYQKIEEMFGSPDPKKNEQFSASSSVPALST